MKTKSSNRFLFASTLVCSFAALSLQYAHAIDYTWDGNGDANASGNWSVLNNWNPDHPTAGGPQLGGDKAILGDVTTGTRTITYDSAAFGSLTTLEVNQSTTAAINELLILKNLSVSNAIALGATAGTERITVGSTAAATFSLNPPTTGGITVNAGGEIVLTGILNTAGTGYQYGNLGNGSSTTTISGGSLIAAPVDPFVGGAPQNTISGNLTMTSGSIIFDNAAPAKNDRRLAINGNLDISGGTISSTRNETTGALFLNGATNILNPTTFDQDLSINLGRGGDQTLDAGVVLNNITVRGTGIKTISNSVTGGNIGAISFIDGNGTTPGSTTMLKLGSNLTLGSGKVQPTFANFSNNVEAGGRVDAGINSNGFILDLSAGASSGVWTPNFANQAAVVTPPNPAVTNTVWTLIDTAGTGAIKANGFNLATVPTAPNILTTNLGAGTTLLAVGGNNTANNLGGTGTIDATSTFRYSGAAVAATPATLTSNRPIGNLDVTSGVLSFGGSGETAGTTSVSGARLILNYATDTSKLANAQVLTLGSSTVELSGGTHVEVVGSTTLNGAVAITRSSGTAALDLGAITNNPGSSLSLSASGIAKTANPNDSSGILGISWVRVAGGLATNNAGTIDAYTGYTGVNRLGGSIVSSATSNVGISNGGGSGNVTLASSPTTVNSLTNTATDGPAIVDLSGPGTLNIASGYLFQNSGSAAFTLGSVLDEGFLTAGGPLNTSATLTISQGSANTLTINSTIEDNGSGVVSLNHTGTGTTLLTSINTFTGKTTLTGGKLSIVDESALGPDPAAFTADQLTFNGGTLLTTATLNIDDANRGITLGAAGGSIEVATGTTANIAATSVITGSGSLTASGPGTLLLSGANTHTGQTNSTLGILRVAHAEALGTTAGNTTIAYGGATTNGGRLELTGGITLAENIVLTGGRTASTFNNAIQSQSGANILTGTVTLTGTGEYRIGTSAGTTLSYNGAISRDGANAGNLLIQANGTVNLNAAIDNNGGGIQFTGTASTVTNLNVAGNDLGDASVYFNGIARLGVNDPLVTTKNLQVGLNNGSTSTDAGGATGTLDLNGFNQTVNALNASRGLSSANSNKRKVTNGLAATTSTLTVGSNNGSGTFDGLIENGAGTVAITKTGTGTATLTSAQTYTGDTTINDGTLALASVTAVSVSASSQTGDTASTTTTLTVPDTTGLVPGQTVTGTGIPAGAIITAVPSTSTLTISAAATATATGVTFNFGAFSVAARNGDLADSGTIRINGTGKLNVGTGINDTVDKLFINGVQQPAGPYTSADPSGAFTGLGTLTVTTGTASSDYDTWDNEYAADLSNKAGDNDNDGLTNFQEYAFGLNPTSGSSVNPISQPLDKTTGVFKYTRRTGTTGVTYTYESSTTLSGWAPFTSSPAETATGSPVEEVTVTVPAELLTNPNLFIHVKAQQP